MMILVTGATGKIGRLVVEHLLSMDTPVRAFVRKEDAFHDIENPLLEVAVGTFEDVPSIEKSVEGIDRIFLVARDNPEQVAQHENVIKVAEQAGVKQIVKLSAFGASTTSPIALMRWHGKTEERLRHSKLSWTFIRPHLYMQNLLRFGKEVATKQTISAPMGVDGFSLVDIRDIAEVVAKVLRNGDHVSKIYTLTGPGAPTYQEIAEHLSVILDHSVQYTRVAQQAFYEKLQANGTPSWRAYDLSFIADAYPGNKKNLITNDIHILLNRHARSIQTFLSDYRINFQG